jgi:regulator of sigma E protease
MVSVAASNPLQALINGTVRTVDVSVMTTMSFVKLFQGQVSPKNLGGMVSIGKVAKDSFEVGPQAFFMTMGILSVSLFILNLMPIPVLDGGHLMFYLIELVKGSPLSLKKVEIAQQVGFVLLLGLMILAQFNDIVKFLFKS